MIKSGLSHTCAIVSKNKNRHLSCWGGNNEYGQSTTPSEFKSNITQVVAGNHLTCVIKSNNRVSCWGVQKEEFKELHNMIHYISTGGRHTCGVRGGF